MDVEEVNEECQHGTAEEMGRNRLQIFKLCPECGDEIVESRAIGDRIMVRMTLVMPLTKPLDDYSEEEMDDLLNEIIEQATPYDEHAEVTLNGWQSW